MAEVASIQFQPYPEFLMGLPGVVVVVVVAIKMTTVVVYSLICAIKSISAKSLSRVRRLINPDEEDLTPPPPPTTTYYTILVVTDGTSSPIIRNVPIHILTSLIKVKAPVVEYATHLDKKKKKKKRKGDSDDDDDDAVYCAVCLTAVERSDEIRELCNCSDVFHRHCLDRWVDENQVTCPLCRSLLFPANWDPDNHNTTSF